VRALAGDSTITRLFPFGAISTTGANFFVFLLFVVARFVTTVLAELVVFRVEREEAAGAFALRLVLELFVNGEFFLGGFAIKFFIMQKL